MKMIKEYYTKNGEKRYMIKTYLGICPVTGKQKHTTRRGFKTKKQASLAESKLKLEVEEKGLSPHKQERMKFSEVTELWLESYKLTVKESTYYQRVLYINKHILPVFGHLYVDKISVVFCQKQVNQWAKQQQHFKHLKGAVKSILDYAKVLKLIKTNPMKEIIIPSKQINKKKENNFYDKNELHQFLKCLKSLNDLKLYTMFHLLAYTGMRKGEMLALTWADIDEVNHLLTISKTASSGFQSRKIINTPKTEKGIRIISLDTATLKLLKQWRKEQRETLLKHGYNSNNAEQLIFSNDNNERYHHDYLNKRLHKIIEKFQLKSITVHGFRHTHCSLLFEAGLSIKQVQDRLGHTDIKTTMDIYHHVTKKQRDETATKFAEFMAL